ncbi:MAG TPA: hypothetical protein VJJ72_02385 [Candidatus Paceibacterota bacterium]
MKKTARQLFIFLVALSLLLPFISLPLEAKAWSATDSLSLLLSWGGGRYFRGLAVDALTTIFEWEGKLLSTMANFMNWAIYLRPYPKLAVITGVWKILRDFANMLFILALIWMAFATLFGKKDYAFATLIKNFLIVAVLINFSLVLGGLVIDTTQVVSNIFLTSIGNVGDRFGEYLNPSLLFPNAPEVGGGVTSFSQYSNQVADKLGASLITLIFTVILLGILLFSFTTAALFALARVPILWVLLTISPIAWMAYIMPGTRKFWNNWWTEFVAWNIFLPIYLFFIYIGLAFLSKQGEILAAVAGTQNITQGVVDSGLSSLTFGLFFFYLFTAYILIQGLSWARSWSVLATKGIGGSVSKRFESRIDWAAGTAKNITGISAGQAAAQNRYKAIKEGATARYGQFQQEGFQNRFLRNIYGGKSAQEQREAKWKERFGIEGSKDAQLKKDIGNWKNKYQNMDNSQLRAQMSQGQEYQRLAAREILQSRNQLSHAEQTQTYDLYAKNNRISAEKFAEGLNYGNMSSADRANWINKVQRNELRKKIQNTRAEKGDFTNLADIRAGATIYTTDSERAEFLKKAGRRIANPRDLAPLISTGSTEEQLAVREIMADRGALRGSELRDTYLLHGDGTEAARKFASDKVKFDKLTAVDRATWFSSPDVTDPDTRRKVVEIAMDKGDFATSAQLENAARLVNPDGTDLFEGLDDKTELLKKAHKNNFLQAVQAEATITGLAPATVMSEHIRRAKPETLAEFSTTTWSDAGFVAAVGARVTALQTANNRRVINVPPAPPEVVPGAGDNFVAKLREAASSDATKLAAISTITPP